MHQLYTCSDHAPQTSAEATITDSIVTTPAEMSRTEYCDFQSVYDYLTKVRTWLNVDKSWREREREREREGVGAWASTK